MREIVEQALRDGDLYKLLLDQMDEGIYIVDCDRRILYWNGGAERITGYYAHEIMGRLCQGDMLMHCEESGRVLSGNECPIQEVMENSAPHEATLYMRHRHGHRIPVHIRSQAICEAGGTRVGAVEIFEEAAAPALPDLSNLAAYDCLDETGALKRRFGEMKARQAVEALNLFGIPFSWLRIELDEMDRLDHRYGHGMVEAAVKMIAETVTANLKTLDWLTYWDRGEFRIEARGYSLMELEDLRRTLQMLVRKSTLAWWGDPVRLTVSVTVRMVERGDTVESLERWESEVEAIGNAQSRGDE
ncbi:MAG TPA: PAS domain S-box protein [Bryobacteraceae bacterium]|nr:PAS domain S-box protein [Bryobacteraceae bacterium]